MIGMTRTAMATVALLLGGLVFAAPAAAHCDSLDGPVVEAAREALATGEVDRVLMWVMESDEAEIRAAFDRTMAARAAGGEAGEVADRWFFETVVRVHRAGEGAAYTGLKPAGYSPPAGIAAADRALQNGSIDGVASGITGRVEEALRERYERVHALSRHAPDDVEAGRRYVAAYVEYIHFVEALHALVEGHATHAGGGADGHQDGRDGPNGHDGRN